MTNETAVKLIVGANLAQELCGNEAIDLREGIAELRRKTNIPLIHITDEIKIEDDNYEIQINEKTILTKKILNTSKNDLIEMIVEDLKMSLT